MVCPSIVLCEDDTRPLASSPGLRRPIEFIKQNVMLNKEGVGTEYTYGVLCLEALSPAKRLQWTPACTVLRNTVTILIMNH